MKVSFATFVMLFCFNGVFAQDYRIEWKRTIDNGSTDKAFSIVVEQDGDVHVTGYSVIGSDADMLTVTYNSAGTLLEADTLGSTHNDYALGIAMDSTGSIYITGKTDNGLNYDFVTYKIVNGVVSWEDTIDRGNHDEAYDVAVDNDSGWVYVTGNIYDPYTDWDRYTVKYSTSGDKIWTRRSYLSGNDLGRAVAVDSQGNVYVGGSISLSDNQHHWYITKYSSDGDLLWVDTLLANSNFDVFIYDLAVDKWDNVYATGKGVSSDGHQVIYTVKFDSSGNILWTEEYGENTSPVAYGIAVDTSCNVYITGKMSISGSYYIVNLEYDSTGSLLWADTVDNSTPYDCGEGIFVDNAGNIYVAGYQYNGSNYDFVTIKYGTNTGVHSRDNVEKPDIKVSLFNEGEIPFSLSLREGKRFRVSLYSVDGRLLECIEGEGSGEYEKRFSAPSGIYFLVLETGERRISKRVIVVE